MTEPQPYVYKIYKLTNPNNNYVYIGSTRTSLQKRLIDHRSRFQRGVAGTLHLCKLFGDNKYDVKINFLDEITISPLKTETEARIIANSFEDKHIQYATILCELNKLQEKPFEIVINKNKAYRAIDCLKQYHKKRYAENREKLIEYQREYCKRTAEKRRKYARERYRKMKEGTWKPREGKYDYNRRDDSIDCECGGKYTPKNKNHHFKTKIHLFYEAKMDWLMNVDISMNYNDFNTLHHHAPPE